MTTSTAITTATTAGQISNEKVQELLAWFGLDLDVQDMIDSGSFSDSLEAMLDGAGFGAAGAGLVGFIRKIEESLKLKAKETLDKEVSSMDGIPSDKTIGDEIGYGGAISANDLLDSNITLYTLDADGKVAMVDFNKDDKANDSISLDAIKEKLGDDLEVSRVEVNGDIGGYFLHNDQGEGFYIDYEDFKLSELDANQLNDFVNSPIVDSTSPATPTSAMPTPTTTTPSTMPKVGVVEVAPSVWSS